MEEPVLLIPKIWVLTWCYPGVNWHFLKLLNSRKWSPLMPWRRVYAIDFCHIRHSWTLKPLVGEVHYITITNILFRWISIPAENHSFPSITFVQILFKIFIRVFVPFSRSVFTLVFFTLLWYLISNIKEKCTKTFLKTSPTKQDSFILETGVSSTLIEYPI